MPAPASGFHFPQASQSLSQLPSNLPRYAIKPGSIEQWIPGFSLQITARLGTWNDDQRGLQEVFSYYWIYQGLYFLVGLTLPLEYVSASSSEPPPAFDSTSLTQVVLDRVLKRFRTLAIQYCPGIPTPQKSARAEDYFLLRAPGSLLHEYCAIMTKPDPPISYHNIISDFSQFIVNTAPQKSTIKINSISEIIYTGYTNAAALAKRIRNSPASVVIRRKDVAMAVRTGLAAMVLKNVFSQDLIHFDLSSDILSAVHTIVRHFYHTIYSPSVLNEEEWERDNAQAESIIMDQLRARAVRDTKPLGFPSSFPKSSKILANAIPEHFGLLAHLTPRFTLEGESNSKDRLASLDKAPSRIGKPILLKKLKSLCDEIGKEIAIGQNPWADRQQYARFCSLPSEKSAPGWISADHGRQWSLGKNWEHSNVDYIKKILPILQITWIYKYRLYLFFRVFGPFLSSLTGSSSLLALLPQVTRRVQIMGAALHIQMIVHNVLTVPEAYDMAKTYFAMLKDIDQPTFRSSSSIPIHKMIEIIDGFEYGALAKPISSYIQSRDQIKPRTFSLASFFRRPKRLKAVWKKAINDKAAELVDHALKWLYELQPAHDPEALQDTFLGYLVPLKMVLLDLDAGRPVSSKRADLKSDVLLHHFRAKKQSK